MVKLETAYTLRQSDKCTKLQTGKYGVPNLDLRCIFFGDGTIEWDVIRNNLGKNNRSH